MSCICVLGMHRSGTSCLTGILQAVGVHLGEVHTQNPHNAKGNREHPRIMRLNDAVLESNGGSWDRPVEVSRWTAPQSLERDEIVDVLSKADAPHWGFKDPRTLFTLPLWRARVEPRFVGTFRHPLRVARSLSQRDDQFTIARGLELWERYNRRLLSLAQEHGLPLVDFDLEPDAYFDEVIRKLAQIGIDDPDVEPARAFFDQTLRRQTATRVDDAELPDDIRELYEALKRHHAMA